MEGQPFVLCPPSPVRRPGAAASRSLRCHRPCGNRTACHRPAGSMSDNRTQSPWISYAFPDNRPLARIVLGPHVWRVPNRIFLPDPVF